MKTLNNIMKTTCEVIGLLLLFMGMGVFGAWENNTLNFLSTFLLSSLMFASSFFCMYLSTQFNVKNNVRYRKVVRHQDNTVKFPPKVA